MNNQQFRKLVLDTPARQAGTSDGGTPTSATPGRAGATPSLGSRNRSSIPMTPQVTSIRSITGYSSSNDFARQLAERNAGPQQPKKFRSSAAPKGAKLAEGYTDRAKLREQQEEKDDKATRVKALEEMWKLQQIDEDTFKKLRDEIVGGDVASTHLVKGLDFKLLERVRRGEDVLNSEAAEEELDEVEVEDEFEKLESKEVVAVQKEKEKKKGEMAQPSLLPPGRKRNRDQILAEMKAARLAAKEAAQPALGSKFRKVGAPRSTSRIERDSKGREVLIMVDEDGNEKRKVRKVQVEEERKPELLMPNKDAKPLGMDVPEIFQVEDEDEDIDIFDDAGDDYDPLAGLEDDDSDSDAEAVDNSDKKEKPSKASSDMLPPPRPKEHSASRNYFNHSKTEDEPFTSSKAMSDPTILAAFKKASTLAPIAQEAKSAEEKAREEKRRKMIMQDDRDAQDIDMGFGGSRFEDGEDEGEERIKLSEWGGDDGGEQGGKKKERKRGSKKRKGDKNSAADVMGVLERRQERDKV